MALPGVKVGPLDPDATQAFGQVAATQSARQLIRLHRQLNPPSLIRALARPLDEPRTKGLDLEEVEQYVRGLTHDNGDPVLPEDARVVGGAVRGDRRTGQTVTFTYELPSGRVGKWFAPYGAEQLPQSFDAGSELAKVKEMKDRGVVAFDSEGTETEILRRHAADLRRENRALREAVEQGAQGDVESAGDEPAIDTRRSDSVVEDNENLRRQNEELLSRVRQLETLTGSRSQTEGADEVLPPQDSVASADPPFAGYDDLKADEVTGYLRADERTPEERQAVLEYERTHANRRTVVGAAEQSLG